MTTAIEFENISKQYRLGLVSTGTLSHDLNRFWQTKILRREDPYLKVGETNDRAHKGSSEYVWALKDINFKVEQGDIVGIIGRNGAGKSTLLKLLSRVTAPTTGTIRAKGRIASLLEVGTGFHPEMTGRENIYMNGAIMGMTRAEITRKLDEIVDFSGCERYLDTPVKRYSSGMTVRLGFAIAAHLEPEILVVDEVLAVGDAEFQKKAIGKMQDVSRGEGRTVLFVSHNMGAVRSLCKSSIVLTNGRITFMGDVDQGISSYTDNSISFFDPNAFKKAKRENNCSGKFTFENIQFFDKNNHQIEEPHCGQYLTVRIFLQARNNLDNCNISFGIRDSFGNPLCTFSSNFTQAPIRFSKGYQHVDLIIPKFPLTQGQYQIGLWGEANGECADYINNTLCFNVADDDFFGKGRTVSPHLKGKVVLCDHEWII